MEFSLSERPLIFLAGIFFGLVLGASSTTWIMAGTLAGRFPEPYPPMFYFSFVIYSIQGLLVLRIFSRQIKGQTVVIGYVACSLLASYSAYEIIFKLSFPLLEPHPDRIGHLVTFDSYPMIVLTNSLLTFLVTRSRWIWSRLFLANLLIVTSLWLSWWGTSFPLKIWEYEKNPELLPLIFNMLTKASTSMLFVTIFKKLGQE